MATLQKLLWCEEYADFCDEVVLVEGRFVLEKKHGECMCMVHAGLTETVVLIAEEQVDPDKECLKTATISKDAASNVEYLHLAHLFPLHGIKLSTRRHQEHRGEHVLRLRLSTGKTWYLELAEGRHREDRWREWLAWIHDVDERRNERRHHHQGKKSTLAEHNQDHVRPAAEASEVGNGMSADDGMTIKQTRSKSSPNTGSDNAIHSSDSGAAFAATRHNKKRRESRAYHWVGHFQGALSRQHDDEMLAKDPNTSYIGLPGNLLDPKVNERDGNSHVSLKHGQGPSTGTKKMDHTSSLVWGEPHSLPAAKSSNSSTDTYSSLQDIESIGSLFGHSDVDWKHPVSGEINRKLLLCVGDLFQKFNMEAHGHGHVGRWRPVASLTALDQLRAPAICKTYGESIFFPSDQEKETLYHRCSVPDILEGEASFLDDLHKAAAVAHRTSLVYMDLLNEDDTKTPHVINGHVMLLSPEQSKLQKEITRSRETAQDLEFVVAGHDGRPMGARNEVKVKHMAKNLSHGNRRKSLAETFKHKLHLGKRVQQCRGENSDDCQRNTTFRSKGIISTIKKVNISRRGGRRGSSINSRGITTIKDVPPELLAIELTLIDSSLFVRVREAELVDCQWLKGDKHSRAPHTTKFIEFFERVVGLVSTEILLLKTVEDRAATMAKFVEVAERCRLMQNFHSLKAVLSGMKVLPIYRLKKTWKAFEEEFSYEFELWNELVFLMTDDGKSGQYKMAVEKSMRSQPCLPFFGVFVLQVVDLYSTVDRSGMRERKFVRVNHNSTSSQNSSTYDSSERDVNGISDDVTATSPSMISSRPTNQAGFFGAFASAWRTVRHPPGKGQHIEEPTNPSGTETHQTTGMTQARKAHIRRLIVSYAKSCAKELGITWRAEPPGETLGAALWAGLDGSLDWGNLFAKVQPTGNTTPPNTEDDEEEKRKKVAEYELYETFFRHQIAAVQYRYESNGLVRDYLLKTSYNTEEQNHRLSMSREPPSD